MGKKRNWIKMIFYRGMEWSNIDRINCILIEFELMIEDGIVFKRLIN